MMCDLHDVVDPRGHPGLGQHLPQHHRLQRGERRGLVHEGVAAGEGGGHLQYSTVQCSAVQYSQYPVPSRCRSAGGSSRPPPRPPRPAAPGRRGPSCRLAAAPAAEGQDIVIVRTAPWSLHLVAHDGGGEAAVIFEAGDDGLEVSPRLPDWLPIVHNIQPSTMMVIELQTKVREEISQSRRLALSHVKHLRTSAVIVKSW